MLFRHNHRVNLTRIRYFLAVVDGGTVTAAAEQLHVAQPAISRQLQQLEHELGVRLFERKNHRLKLTSAGRAFAPMAADLVVQAEHLRYAAHQLADGVVRHLVLAAPQASVTEIVAPFLATLSPADPLIHVQHDAPLRMHAALRSGADLVISTEPPLRSHAWRSLIDVPLRAYVATSHEWARTKREAVTLPELVAEDLILLTGEHVTRTILDQAVTRAGLDYGHVEECRVSRVVQALAAAGFGVGVVTDRPRFCTHSVLLEESTALHTPLLLSLHAAWDPKHHAAATIESLVDRMASHAITRRSVDYPQ
jgi:DNA-binding transcriptional LysR family regulator